MGIHNKNRLAQEIWEKVQKFVKVVQCLHKKLCGLYV